jgi:Holliday junction resolvasome RuvABC endonuclease subunit
MVKILGLDISSVSTGHCIINNGRLLRSTLGTINPNAKSLMGEKLLYFETRVRELIQEHKPDLVVIEDIFKGPNVNTFKTLAMFRGICFKVVFEEMQSTPISIMPTEARKIIGASGVTKQDGFDFITKKYSFTNYDFNKHSDIVDSIALALSYHELCKRGIEKEYFINRKKVKKRRRKKKAKK